MKKVKFTKNVYDAGFVKYAVGAVLPLTPETQRQVGRGNAEVVEVKEPKANNQAIAAAKKALAAAESKVQAAQEALGKAKDKDVPAAQQAVTDAEAEVTAAREALEKAETPSTD